MCCKNCVHFKLKTNLKRVKCSLNNNYFFLLHYFTVCSKVVWISVITWFLFENRHTIIKAGFSELPSCPIRGFFITLTGHKQKKHHKLKVIPYIRNSKDDENQKKRKIWGVLKGSFENQTINYGIILET